jgi:hypothetical protein
VEHDLALVLIRRDESPAPSPPPCNCAHESRLVGKGNPICEVALTPVIQLLGFKDKTVMVVAVPKSDRVGEQCGRRSHLLPEVIGYDRRHDHVCREGDQTGRIPSEDEVQRGRGKVGGSTDFGARAVNVVCREHRHEVECVEEVALAGAVMPDDARQRPEADLGPFDALEVLDP